MLSLKFWILKRYRPLVSLKYAISSSHSLPSQILVLKSIHSIRRKRLSRCKAICSGRGSECISKISHLRKEVESGRYLRMKCSVCFIRMHNYLFFFCQNYDFPCSLWVDQKWLEIPFHEISCTSDSINFDTYQQKSYILFENVV